MLKCQEDSSLREFNSVIKTFTLGDFKVPNMGNIKTYGVTFQDTIFFPGGGGQPSDLGKVHFKNEDGTNLTADIVHVFRNGGDPVTHVLDPEIISAIEHSTIGVGSEALQMISWPRRLYHMTHHSGQHLISALAMQLFGFKTLSWSLTETYCYVELGVEHMADEQYFELQNEVNKYIEMARPVTVHLYEKGDAALERATSRGLPKDQDGGVRVVEIQGLDFNKCCGTHVPNTAKLEVIKFLKTERKVSKQTKSSLLYFVVGHELLFKKFDEMLGIQTQICTILNEPPEALPPAVNKMKRNLQAALKREEALEEEVVQEKINAFKAITPLPALFSLHRPHGSLDLLKFITRQFKDVKNVTLFLTVGENDEGSVSFISSVEVVAKIAPIILAAMEGRGQARGERFQAKVTNLKGRQLVEENIEELIQ